MTDVPVIQIHQLTKQFDDHIAVDQLSLEVYAGEVYGPNWPQRRWQNDADSAAVNGWTRRRQGRSFN